MQTRIQARIYLLGNNRVEIDAQDARTRQLQLLIRNLTFLLREPEVDAGHVVFV